MVIFITRNESAVNWLIHHFGESCNYRGGLIYRLFRFLAYIGGVRSTDPKKERKDNDPENTRFFHLGFPGADFQYAARENREICRRSRLGGREVAQWLEMDFY
jgi:hypothetical protein